MTSLEEDFSPDNVWVWRDDTDTLVCVPKQDADLLRDYWAGHSKSDRAIRSNHDKALLKSIYNFTKLNEKTQHHNSPFAFHFDLSINPKESKIGLNHVKRAALNLIAEKHLRKMLVGAVMKFDTCLTFESFDKLLLCSIRYFHDFLRLSQFCDVGDNAYKYLDSSSKEWEKKISQTKTDFSRMKASLARIYSSLLLCLGLDESMHHSNHGKQRTSKSQIDNQFFEALYDYLLFGVWVTFGRKHWEQIKSCIGVLFKAPFVVCLDKTPPPLDNEGKVSIDFARIGRESKDLILSVTKHKYTRSKVLQVVLPVSVSSQDSQSKSAPLGAEPGLEELRQLTENAGIMGADLALYDPMSLELLPESVRLSNASFARSKLSSTTLDHSHSASRP